MSELRAEVTPNIQEKGEFDPRMVTLTNGRTVSLESLSISSPNADDPLN